MANPRRGTRFPLDWLADWAPEVMPGRLHATPGPDTGWCQSPSLMTKAEVMRRLREDVLADKSMRSAAARYNVSPQYLSKVLLEQKPLGPKLLGALGLKRVRRVEYQPIA